MAITTELLIVYFSDRGVPATGLTPVLNGWNAPEGIKELISAPMEEMGNGFYTYSWTSYDDAQDYVFIADGGDSLSNSDRYVVFGNGNATLKYQNMIMRPGDEDTYDRTTDCLQAIRESQLSSNNWEATPS